MNNELTVSTNKGHMTFDKKAKLKLFHLNVFFNEKSMATILFLKDIANIPRYRITMDTEIN